MIGCANLVDVLALAKALAIVPASFVVVAALVAERSLAISEAEAPVPGVGGAICPGHFTKAMPETSKHFSLINRARLVFNGLVFNWAFRIVYLGTQHCFEELLEGEVS